MACRRGGWGPHIPVLAVATEGRRACGKNPKGRLFISGGAARERRASRRWGQEQKGAVGEGQERAKGEVGQVAGAPGQDARRPTEPVHYCPQVPSTMFPKQTRPPDPALPTCPVVCPSRPDCWLAPSLPLSFRTVSLRLVFVAGGKGWGRWGSEFSCVLSTELGDPRQPSSRCRMGLRDELSPEAGSPVTPDSHRSASSCLRRPRFCSQTLTCTFHKSGPKLFID